MKKLNKIIIVLFVLFFAISTACFAVTTNFDKLKLEIVENNICTIKIKDTAVFEKKLIDYNLDKKELTLQMKISNIAEKPLAGPTEIMLVVDTSDSMSHPVSSGVTRMDAIKDATNKLASELLKNENVKIGIVTFSTSSNFGTIEDAKLKTAPISSKEDISSIVSSITYEGNGQTDIDAGLTLANQNFTTDAQNKIIVLLTDGVPNYAIGQSTFEYSGNTAELTKNTLNKLTNDENVNVISVMTGVTNDEEATGRTGMTYKELAEEIFGTPSNPNYGKFYYISDSDIEKTIAQDVLKDITTSDEGVLTNIDIYDYFPQEIVDNFDFEYVTSPNLGKISPSINLENNYILWHIDSLAYGEVGTVSYKLTVKPTVDSSIINVVLNTNKKVDITADELPNPVSSDVSPKIRLTGDTTKAPDKIPQAGVSNTVTTSIVIVSSLGLLIGIRLYILNKNTK